MKTRKTVGLIRAPKLTIPNNFNTTKQFSTPPSAAESLSSPFAFLSLALSNLSSSFDRLYSVFSKYRQPKLPFLTPPSAAESLSSPFAFLSLALSTLSFSFDRLYSVFSKYRRPKLPFLTPPSAAESLSSPFAILSLALSSLSLSLDRLYSVFSKYRQPKLSFLTPPSAAESLSSPFAFLSLALSNLSLSLDRLYSVFSKYRQPKLPFLTPPSAAGSLSSPLIAIFSLALLNLYLSFDDRFSTQPFQSIAKTFRYAEILSASPFVHAFVGYQIQLKLSHEPWTEKSSAHAPSTVLRDYCEPFPFAFDSLYEVIAPAFYDFGSHSHSLYLLTSLIVIL